MSSSVSEGIAGDGYKCTTLGRPAWITVTYHCPLHVCSAMPVTLPKKPPGHGPLQVEDTLLPVP